MDHDTPSSTDHPAGGCLCGGVRFAAGGAPITARACWCRLCQYLGAGGPTVNVAFATAGFAVTGEVRWHESIADSGNRMARGFCPACGTPLFSKAEARPQLIFVRAGALDQSNLCRRTGYRRLCCTQVEVTSVELCPGNGVDLQGNADLRCQRRPRRLLRVRGDSGEQAHYECRSDRLGWKHARSLREGVRV